MTGDRNSSAELERLLLDLLDGEWDATKQERLDELLRADADARARYRELMAMHAMLDAEFSGSLKLNDDGLVHEEPGEPPPHVRLADRESPSDLSRKATRTNRWLSSLGWLTAAVVAAAVGVWAFVSNDGHRDDRQQVVESDLGGGSPPDDGSHPQDTTIAMVTRVIRAQWEESAVAVRPGQALEKQWIKLKSGIVQIEFASSARVTLEGPAQLRLDSGSECFVQAGKLTVLAPPAAANFTVKSSISEVVDLGTEFGLVVGESGEVNLHVLDGEVEVAVMGTGERAVPRQKLVEAQAATVRPGQERFENVPFDETVFEPIRAATLWRTQPLKIQFDCGSHAGVYHGTQSPAHAAGDMYPHETYWNPLVGDQSGRFVLADGTVLSHRIEVDVGHGKKDIDWSAELDTMTGPQGKTRGVFDTAMGRDAINPPTLPASNVVGMRLRGLPNGKYRVYVVGRTSLDHANWGNYLVEKAHLATVGLNLTDSDTSPLTMAPLDDPNARTWVAGQTHVVTDVDVSGPDQYLTIITSKDRENSPTPAGGRAVILGVQILQITD